MTSRIQDNNPATSNNVSGTAPTDRGFHPVAFIQNLFGRLFSTILPLEEIFFNVHQVPSSIFRMDSLSQSATSDDDWQEITLPHVIPIQDSLINDRLTTWLEAEDGSDPHSKQTAYTQITTFIAHEESSLLNLEGLNLHTLPNIFFHDAFQRVQTLNLAGNLLEEFPSSLTNLPHSLSILIELNHINKLPKELCSDETKQCITDTISHLPLQVTEAPTVIAVNSKAEYPLDPLFLYILDALIENHKLQAAIELTDALENPDLKAIKLQEIQEASDTQVANMIDDLVDDLQLQTAIEFTDAIENPDLKLEKFNQIKEISDRRYEDYPDDVFEPEEENKQATELARLNTLQPVTQARAFFESLPSTEPTNTNLDHAIKLLEMADRSVTSGNFKSAKAALDTFNKNSIVPLDKLDTLDYILEALIENNEFKTALHLFHTVLASQDVPESYKINTLIYVIESLVEKRQPKLVENLIQNLQNGSYHSKALKILSNALLKSHDINTALEVAYAIEDPALQSTQLLHIADAFIQNGKLEKALKILEGPFINPHPHLRSMRLLGIAELFMQRNQPEKALDALWQVPDNDPYKIYILTSLLEKFRLDMLERLSKIQPNVLSRVDQIFMDQLMETIVSSNAPTPAEQKALGAKLTREIGYAEDRLRYSKST